MHKKLDIPVLTEAAIIFLSLPAGASDLLWIDDLHAPMFTTVDVPVYLENSETPVHAFSFRLITDDSVVSYTSYLSGTLTSDFDMLVAGEPVQGEIVVTGYDSEAGIPVGSSGTIVLLRFSVMTGYTDLVFSDLGEDIAGFGCNSGSFLACQPEFTWLTRSLPDTCYPGVAFTATYSYQGGSAAIIQTAETVPDGWSITHPPWDELIGNTYIWYEPIYSSTILPPEDAPGGSYDIDGTTISTHWCNGDVTHDITGDQSIVLDDGTTPTPTPPCPHTGDVNQDSALTAEDAQLAFQIVLWVYLPTWDEACAADCNGDGEYTAGDAQGIFLAALGMGLCEDPVPTPTITPTPTQTQTPTSTGTPTPNMPLNWKN